MDIDGLTATAQTLWLLWLVALFLAVVAWAYWPRHKARFERDGRIPLEDDRV